MPPLRIYHSDKSVFLMQRYLFSSLSQSVSTRPFLTTVEKVWIAWQVLRGVEQVHALGLCHGNIRPSNVLLTSWHWVFLVDHAPYKPAFLPPDDPADFSMLFDTDGRRSAYLAPERFVDGGGAARGEPAWEQLTPAMDIFSAGCTIAELFLDGQPLFTYSKVSCVGEEMGGGALGGLESFVSKAAVL